MNPLFALAALVCLILVIVLLPQLYAFMPRDWGGPTWFNNLAYLLIPFSFILAFMVAVIYRHE